MNIGMELNLKVEKKQRMMISRFSMLYVQKQVSGNLSSKGKVLLM
jgi:hypothetical protein